LFLGRLANFANGELFGRVSHAVPWVMVFPNGGEEPRHPSQLYEAFAEGVLLFVILNALWWGVAKYRNRTGFTTAWFFILYGIFRFGLEYFREPDGHLGFILGELSMGQLLCVPMILFGVWVLVKTSPRSKLKRLKEDL
jgi:phosphatidylglycerol:prolipoprotein diacylglycerol transferase